MARNKGIKDEDFNNPYNNAGPPVKMEGRGKAAVNEKLYQVGERAYRRQIYMSSSPNMMKAIEANKKAVEGSIRKLGSRAVATVSKRKTILGAATSLFGILASYVSKADEDKAENTLAKQESNRMGVIQRNEYNKGVEHPVKGNIQRKPGYKSTNPAPVGEASKGYDPLPKDIKKKK